MLLDEPATTAGELHFRLLGFPVRVHPLFWLVMVVFGLGSVHAREGRAVLEELCLWVMAAFVSLLLHELGHALVMRLYGYQPSITLYGFGGYASYNSTRQPGLWPQMFIAAAGPAVQLLLMVGLAAVLIWREYDVSIYRWGPAYFALPTGGEQIYTTGLTLFVRDLMLVSSLWAYFNLLPVYPMDGGQIARGLLVLLRPQEGVRLSLVLSIVVGGGMTAWCFWAGAQFTGYFMLMMTVANVQALAQPS